jgi:DNA-binding transcriptional MerR regulator
MASANTFSIGDLAGQTGTKVETIRYYEKAGLMSPAARTSGNHRAYTQAHIDRLAFIRHSRELGFPLETVRTLLTMADDPTQSCAEVDSIARQHLASVRSRIARLQALEVELSRMVQECGCGRVADCRVIEVLADQTHAHCLSPDHHGTGL